MPASLEVRLRQAAEDDLAASVHHFEEIRPGLGYEFLMVIESLLERISRHPRRYPKVLHEVRRALPIRFAYSVYYLERTDHIQVIAILHQRRDPRIWKGRALEERDRPPRT